MKKTTQLKEFFLSSASIKNRTTVFVIIALILISGISSYISMPRESFPEVVIPQIYIGTPYPGNSAADIEKLITRPLEKEIKGITGIDKITSTSVQGYSTIFIEFDFSVSVEEALRKVKDKVDAAKSDPDFPTDLPADPNIFEMNISEMAPVLNINLSGDYSIEQLNEYAEFLEDKIETLPEITEVDIRGVQKKEMKINVDLIKMESLKISFNDISNAIRSENMSISGGDIISNGIRRTVSVNGEFRDVADIEEVIVKMQKQEIVYLKDIAEVVFEEEEKRSYAREYGKSVVMVDVKKRAGKNLIDASDKINVILADAKANLFPSDLTVTLTNDQSKNTRTMVSELENSIIFGVLLVVLVLLFFLGVRNALFVGVAIPLSMFMAFMILSAMGVTLNMMVLFSLILALGMLVDNGIVVVENIYRLMDEGYEPFDAAKYGVGEVAWPIISSTATTLAAFLPLAFWPGMMGQFMKFLPITLIIVLGSSLFVALVVNPVLTALYMKVKEDKPNLRKLFTSSSIIMIVGILFLVMEVTWLGNLIIIFGVFGLLNHFILTPATAFFNGVLLPWLDGVYHKFLSFALQGYWPIAFLFGTFGFLIFSGLLMGVFPPKVIFFPEGQPQYLNIFIEAPIGTDIEETNDITKKLEARIFNYVKKFDEQVVVDGKELTKNFLVESVIAQVGEGTSDPSQGASFNNTPHKARITVSFVEFKYRRGENTSDVLTEVRKLVQGIPGIEVVVDKNQNGPPQGKPVNIEIAGDDYENLIAQAEKIKGFIEKNNIGGIEELKLDVELGKPEMPITLDRRKARRLNLSTSQIGQQLRTSLFGLEVSTYKEGEDDYPIMLRLADEYRYDEERLMSQSITFRDQMTGKIRQVPLNAVATAEKQSTFSQVKRKNLNRIITISSNVLDGYNANEVVAEIKETLKDFALPEENTLNFTGQQEEQAKEMAFLSSALMIAVFMIFLILVSQFNSASTPLIIVLSVVFSLIGVFIGLVAFRMDFIVIMTMIGIISLAGIVVNNAIVLIDYTKLLMERRKEDLGLTEDQNLSVPDVIDCLVNGGKTRLRPVLLTAITTILGLVPLATGFNVDFVGLLNDYDPNIFMGGDNVMFWGPMSWTVIFGLTFATFLTLVIVPVMLYLLTRFKYKYFSKA